MNESKHAGTGRGKSRIYSLAMTAVMAAVLCVLAPIAIPIGPVPVSFSLLVIFLSLYLLGWKWGTVSVLVYLLLGLLGAPVFTGLTGGVGKLLGPTGGYLIGYLPMAVLAGLVIDRFRGRWAHLVGMAAATAVCYAFGTAWYCIQAGVPVGGALAACVLPFIPVDLIKIAVAMIIGPLLRDRLTQAGLL